MRVLVDSSVWIDHFRGHDSRETRLFREMLVSLDPLAAGMVPEIVVGDLILCEVLRGIDDEAQQERVRCVLLAFDQISLGGTEMALVAAEHYRALRRIGITLRKTIDCLIATWCIAEAALLLHADRDFTPFANHRGLRVL